MFVKADKNRDNKLDSRELQAFLKMVMQGAQMGQEAI